MIGSSMPSYFISSDISLQYGWQSAWLFFLAGCGVHARVSQHIVFVPACSRTAPVMCPDGCTSSLQAYVFLARCSLLARLQRPDGRCAIGNYSGLCCVLLQARLYDR